MRGELENILEHVSALSALDLAERPADVAPARPRERALGRRAAPLRDARADALRNAPDPVDGGFRVPPIGA